MFAVLLLTVLGFLIIWFAKPLTRYATQMLHEASFEELFVTGYRIGGLILFLLAALMFLNLIGVFKLH
jgi:hypothetical protein